MNNPRFTIGCDPEFFLRERASGKLISAIPHVKGTKHFPQPLKGGNIQHDNVAVEVATDPADCVEKFVDTIKTLLGEATKSLPSDTEIVALPSACFDEDQLQDPEALAFGCDPDYCAWELRQNDSPSAEDHTFRSCGAHIHVGTDGTDENSFLLDPMGKVRMVRVMDCVHGVISTILDSSDESVARRKLYGKPGAHRAKEYGVEYRVLSNYWLKSPITVMLMYHLTQDALKVVRDGKDESLIEEMDESQVRDTILTGNSEAAKKMFELNVLPLLSEDSIGYFEQALSKINGNDMNFHKEWKLYKEVSV
jgi:hypothetical protein